MGYDYYRHDQPEPRPYPIWKLTLDLILLAACAVIVGLSLGG